MYNIRSVCSTLCAMFGVPALTDAPAMEEALDLLPGHRADRVLMYNPDAVAWWIFEKYRPLFDPAFETDPLVLRMESVMPSVTPVCFATMYSGLMPAEHGIRSYTKPVLTVDTVFDALIEGGMKPAICSTGTDSISLIFKNREMDYFIFDTPDEVNDKAEELIRADRHDLIVAYNGNYGRHHAWARTGRRPIPRRAVSQHGSVQKAHRRRGGSMEGQELGGGFATDHGCHTLPDGRGTHGSDLKEDMNVVHLWTGGTRM